MKRRGMLVSVIGIIIVIAIAEIMYNSNKDMTFSEDGIMYAVNVNGKKQNNFPEKGLYKVDVTCENAQGKWDYNNWKLYLENMTGVVSCDINFTTIVKNYLNDKIMELSETTQGTGKVVNENGYRYEGKSPNNYVWFNDEMWRIIGVFDSSSHGQSSQNLVKIIKEDSIGGLSWNKSSSSNNWGDSDLYKLLNPVTELNNSGAYYKKEDGSNSDYCYGYRYIETNCDYRQKGISVAYRNMIKNVTWYLGYSGTSDVTAATIYNSERTTTTTTNGYIGLMYASDYGYSVLASSCARTINLSSYNTAACAGQSWLFGQGSEWTLTPYRNSPYVFFISDIGSMGSYSINNGLISYDPQIGYSGSVRPTLYLDASVYVVDGDGSITNPYIIGM